MLQKALLLRMGTEDFTEDGLGAGAPTTGLV